MLLGKFRLGRERLGIGTLHASAQVLQRAELQLFYCALGTSQGLRNFTNTLLLGEAHCYHAALIFRKLVYQAKDPRALTLPVGRINYVVAVLVDHDATGGAHPPVIFTQERLKVEERLPGGECRQRHGRGLDEAEALGLDGAVLGRDRRQLGVAAVGVPAFLANMSLTCWRFSSATRLSP